MTDGRSLPGTSAPYFMRDGEGERYLVGSHLATVVARPDDTGGRLECVVWSGGKGASMPWHEHRHGHEAVLVLNGTLEISIGNRRLTLTRGDYASIPPGTPHAHRLLAHGTRAVVWTVNGQAHQFCRELGVPFGGTAYPPDGGAQAGLDTSRLKEADTTFGEQPEEATPQESGQDLVTAYSVESGEGERLLAGDQLFTFLSHQKHTNGAFIALMTAGPPGAPIPKHFHEKHAETFLCLDGRMTMWIGEEELQLTSGDFLHVPAGTIHSYRLDSPYTRFAGVLAPGLFEPFFRAMCEPFSGHTFPLLPGPVRFDRVMQRLHELDLKLVGPPPGPPPGAPPRST